MDRNQRLIYRQTKPGLRSAIIRLWLGSDLVVIVFRLNHLRSKGQPHWTTLLMGGLTDGLTDWHTISSFWLLSASFNLYQILWTYINFYQPLSTSVNLCPHLPTSVNLSQPQSISVNLSKSQLNSAYLGRPKSTSVLLSQPSQIPVNPIQSQSTSVNLYGPY